MVEHEFVQAAAGLAAHDILVGAGAGVEGSAAGALALGTHQARAAGDALQRVGAEEVAVGEVGLVALFVGPVGRVAGVGELVRRRAEELRVDVGLALGGVGPLGLHEELRAPARGWHRLTSPKLQVT